MPQPPSDNGGRGDELKIPLDGVAKFVRQLSHDVRNNLGSIDLQAAFLAELVSDPEVVAELRKLRGMVASGAKSLQSVSAKFAVQNPNLVTLSAAMFLEDFRDRLARLHPDEAPKVQWSVQLGEEEIAVDIEMLFTALAEVFRNTFQFHEPGGPITATAESRGGELVIEIRQRLSATDTPPETWGCTPLTTTRRGAYGLGVFHARKLLAAHGGAVEFFHDSAATVLTTRVVLPLADPPE